MKKIITFNDVLTIMFFAGATMGLLAQWLSYPGKTFQVIGTLVMAVVVMIWTAKA